jgi:acyl carrier protein
MALRDQSEVRDFITQRLRVRGDLAPLNDLDPLFENGRLDSLDAVEVIMFLEGFGIDFSAFNFDLTLIDSVAAISDLIDRHNAGIG